MSDTSDMAERLHDIDQRRIDAFRQGGLDAIPEATTADDIHTLQEARRMLDDFSRGLLDLYAEVWREWGKHRCSVCGNTPAQSAAIGYDCIREC